MKHKNPDGKNGHVSVRISMQRTSENEAKAFKDLNEKDMAVKVETLKDINTKWGHEALEFNIAMNGQYNSVTTASHKQPGHNVLQAIGTA